MKRDQDYQTPNAVCVSVCFPASCPASCREMQFALNVLRSQAELCPPCKYCPVTLASRALFLLTECYLESYINHFNLRTCVKMSLHLSLIDENAMNQRENLLLIFL